MKLMPLYTLKRKSTGEVWDVNCKYDELKATLAEDDDLIQELSTPAFTANGTRDNLSRAGGEWRDLMGRIKKASGKGNTIKT